MYTEQYLNLTTHTNMLMKTNKTVGVVVGRFQTPVLHVGHRYILDVATELSDELLIAVGVSGGPASAKNPLDFDTRVLMLTEAYPHATIVPVFDNASDEMWSKLLDARIAETFPEHDAILFGSRDCFISHYHGVHPFREVKPRDHVCATDLRNAAVETPRNTEDFRAGMMYAHIKQSYPTSYQAVDMIIRHSTEDLVLIGRKPNEHGWRFPGGFVDPHDSHLEHTVRREAREELGDIEINGIRYIRSMRVNDHRYRGSQHGLMTALFTATYVYGRIEAGDDLAEVRWQPIDTLLEQLIETHKPLGEVFLETLKQ